MLSHCVAEGGKTFLSLEFYYLIYSSDLAVMVQIPSQYKGITNKNFSALVPLIKSRLFLKPISFQVLHLITYNINGYRRKEDILGNLP